MAKYIDRDSLIEWLKRIPLKDLSDGLGLCRAIMEDDFKKAIKKMPKGIIVDVAPTMDAVPVVRCKDCKWLYDEMGDYCCRSHRGLVRICENSFCSYGERKEGDGNG